MLRTNHNRMGKAFFILLLIAGTAQGQSVPANAASRTNPAIHADAPHSGADSLHLGTAVIPDSLEQYFQHPPASARPWVFWYWMQASVSREGIRADLLAMKAAGIGGAYLMPIKGAANPPLIDPPVEQLSPAWWEMVRYAMKEADSLGLELAMHACDGFAIAGGPWITPELSMQKVVWTKTVVKGGGRYEGQLSQPETNEHYYRDIAVLAFPTRSEWDASSLTIIPHVSTDRPGPAPQFLATAGNKESFKSDEPCWIQYAFHRPFTCRTIVIHTNGNNYEAQRLLLEVSNNGRNFRTVGRLESPRHGWQDGDADVTHTIPAVKARYFRFVYYKSGSEPGAEDLDAAKWKPTLKLSGIELSATPAIYQFEGKTGAVWRVSHRTTAAQLPNSLCIPSDKIIDISDRVDTNGHIVWNAPAGHWTILRMGHTSTGHTNATGGGGKGLECDKFNPAAAELQFDHWFGEAIRQAGPELAGRVLKIFHVDSWECGSQNWSPVFREEFRRRRGYDCLSYLPAMAGVPVGTADVSERFLHDIRQTIAELINDKFYVTMARLAHAKGCSFSAESVAPTMTSDGMLHYQTADIPMGEFWLRSPTHDKPNDMLDAISGAHIYGKPVIQAEGFTELRMAWDEYPGMLKTLQDRNYALGINRLVFHVFAHNPWMDRRPGMTLDGVGSYFQRDQTWWKPGRAWMEYTQRCQWLLQQGRPVADLAVFTGEEIPRRAVLPERLVSTLPGLFGAERGAEETRRLANEGQPVSSQPGGVVHSANMADPKDWIDPLDGYAFDSFNPDALLRLATVSKGQIVLPGGARYAMLVLPGAYPLSPDAGRVSAPVAARVLQLVKEGATLLVGEPDADIVADRYSTITSGWHSTGLWDAGHNDSIVQDVYRQLLGGDSRVSRVGEGRVIKGPFQETSFESIGLQRDFIATESIAKAMKRYGFDSSAVTATGAVSATAVVSATGAMPATDIAYTHRAAPGLDIYFVSNQLDQPRRLDLSLRVEGRIPELWDAVTGEISMAWGWRPEQGRTIVPVQLPANGSIFIVLRKTVPPVMENGVAIMRPVVIVGDNELKPIQTLTGAWELRFDPALGGPASPVVFDTLQDWSKNADTAIRYYSGTVTYNSSFEWTTAARGGRVWLDLGHVANIASVRLNGIDCGVAWTEPYRVEISKAIRPGTNRLSIEVTNTWANRLTGDHGLPEGKRITWTTAPYHLDGKLLEAGLLGPVRIGVTSR